MRRLRLALAALALPAWLVAQQAEFPSAVEVVRIDVVALDRDERPVEGLRASDFELLEDSRPQAITSFEAVVVRGQAPEPIEVPRTGRTGRSSGRLPRLPAGGFLPGRLLADGGRP